DTGIEGMGWVTTRSPTVSTTGTPFSSQAAQSTPASRPPMRPARTGAYSLEPTNEPLMSVPPLARPPPVAPRPDRGVPVGPDERAADVRPAAGRVDPQVGADVLHDPAVA